MITEKNAFITKVAIHLGSSIRRRLAVRRNPSAWALSRSTVSVGEVMGLAVTVMSINQLLGVDDAEDERGDRPQHYEQQQRGGDRIDDVVVTAERIEDEEVGQHDSGVCSAFVHQKHQLKI